MYPTKKLSETCEIINWWTPDTTIQEYWNGDIFWITPKDMWQLESIYVSKTSRTITQSGVNNSSAKIIPINSVILSSRAPIGHLSINWVPMCTNQWCKWLIPRSELNYIYLYYFLLNSKDLLNNLWSGTTFKELSSTKLKEVEIPLPSLSTQSRIVARLDSAFASIDEQISLLWANIRDVENMRKSVLEESLISEDFEIKKIDDISIAIQYGYTGKTVESGKYKLLRITDIQDNAIDWNTVPFVDITDTEAKKYQLNVWDIVFARTGATVWKSCTINNEWVWQVFASYLIRVVVKPWILTSEFLQYFFYSKYYWDQIYADVVWAAQPNFNGSKLKEIQIPLPSPPRQHEIVTHLDRVFAETTLLRWEYEAQIRDLGTLKQSLLEEAFAGRLVTDEE